VNVSSSTQWLLLVAMAGLTGCGGAGATRAAPAVAAATPGLNPASFTIRVPQRTSASSTRGTAYISYATQSMQVNVDPGTPGEQDHEIDLTPTSPGCAPSGILGILTCTISLGIVPGSHHADLISYDRIGGTVGGGAVLSAAYAYPFSVSAGVANALTFTLGGVAASFLVAPANPAQVSGTPAAGFAFTVGAAQRILVYALDADQNAIVGPGSPAVTAQSSDPALQVSAVTGNPNAFDVSPTAYKTTPTNVSVTAPNTTGSALPALTSTISFALTFQPIVVRCQSRVCNAGPGGTTDSLLPTEAGYSGAFTFSSTTPSICTVLSTTATTATLTSPGSVGTCNITVTDGYGQPASVGDVFPTIITLSGSGVCGNNASACGVVTCSQSLHLGPYACSSQDVIVTDSNPSGTFSFATVVFTTGVYCYRNGPGVLVNGTPIFPLVSWSLPPASGGHTRAQAIQGANPSLGPGTASSTCGVTVVDNFGGTVMLELDITSTTV
jgi:hypothetical protein